MRETSLSALTFVLLVIIKSAPVRFLRHGGGAGSRTSEGLRQGGLPRGGRASRQHRQLAGAQYTGAAA